MDKYLHIVTHEVPWPANFGGVVDLFYKLVWLQKLGVKIRLHCFVSKRARQPLLEQYCESVTYYQRKTGPRGFSFGLPYIVHSRRDDGLLENLNKDNYPVLLEGIHCTGLLYKGFLEGRKVFVRLHNIEFNYYRQLAKHERDIFKKLYYRWESRLLKQYERKLARKAFFLTVSTEDASLYKKVLKADQAHFLPVFLPWESPSLQPGRGCFCLYHGNLSVNENERAAEWLLNEVFKGLDIPLVIAGKDPSLRLQSLAHGHKNTCIVCNPTEKEMQDLLAKAQVNILPSFNNTGVKLKLLNALYNGKHCLVNHAGVDGSALESLCHIAESAGEFRNAIRQLFSEDFDVVQIREREKILGTVYNNEENARQLIAWIY